MSSWTRRDLLRSLGGAGAVALGGPVLLGACGGDDDDAATTTTGAPGSSTTAAAASGDLTSVGLQLSWTHSVQFGGSYLAAERGYYTQNGLDVALSPGGPNVAGDAQTVSGQVLMNISGGDGVARSNAEGAKLKVVGVQYQKAPGTLLSLAENPITTPEDLVGKSIGVAGTDTPALDAFARVNGLAEGDFTKVPSQYDPAEVVSGNVDCIFCFYNDLPVALGVQGIEYATLLLSDFGFNPHSQVYTVRAESLESDERDLIIALLRGEILGWQDYRTDYLEAAQLSVDTYPDAGLDLETQEVQAEVQLDLMYSELTDENGFAWFTDEGIAENLELFELLEVDAGGEDMWDRSLLEEIFADGPTL
ncbi:MAG: ABC transporter substrate-binding protein [Actinomycetota bacterium]|nr:ABC transporter substrate-binding protein [Actinomycetota bacterium]